MDLSMFGGGFPAGLSSSTPTPLPPSLEPVGTSAASGAPPSFFDQESLVAKVKEVQREGQHAKDLWVAFTNAHGGGTKDPNRHSAEFLQGFLDAYSSGQWTAQAGATGGAPGAGSFIYLVSKVKEMQRGDSRAKHEWIAYTDLNGKGTRDPNKHDAAFLQAFLDHYNSGQSLAEMGGIMFEMDGNPAKRMRGPGGVDPTKDALVERVKAFQRLGNEHKELWSLYADTYLGGTRDPSRHDAQVLAEFCVNHGVPEASGSASLGALAAATSAKGTWGMA